MSTGRGGRGSAMSSQSRSQSKSKAQGKRGGSAQANSGPGNCHQGHSKQEGLLFARGKADTGVEFDVSDDDEDDDDMPELTPAPPQDMECDCGDAECIKRIYFKEKWPFPEDMIARLYSLECTSLVGCLVHEDKINIEDAKEALDLMDSKDEASRAKCWRHTWRVDVLTKDNEVPLSVMDDLVPTTTQAIIDDLSKEVKAILINGTSSVHNRDAVYRGFANPDPTVKANAYPFPWSVRYLYQHLGNKGLAMDEVTNTFYQALDRLEYKYEWVAIGGVRLATKQRRKALEALRKQEEVAQAAAASPPRASKAKGPATKLPEKKEQKPQAAAPKAGGGGGSVRPSPAPKPRNLYPNDDEDDDDDDEPPELVPFNPAPQAAATATQPQRPPPHKAPSQQQPQQNASAQQAKPKAPVQQPPQQLPTQAPRPTAAPARGPAPNGAVNGGASAAPPAQRQPEPTRAQPVQRQPPAQQSFVPPTREAAGAPAGKSTRSSVELKKRQAEAERLDRERAQRAQAEAELLAMIEAEEQKTAKVGGSTAAGAGKKKNKKKKRRRGKTSSTGNLSTSGQPSNATSSQATALDSDPSSSEDESQEESDIEVEILTTVVEPKIPAPPPVEHLKELSLPGVPPPMPRELQDLQSTSRGEVEMGRDGEVLVPDEFLCPISLVRMVDPVVAADGNTYERDSIERWIARAAAHGKTLSSPLTNEHMGMALIPNNNLRKLILTYCEQNGVAYFQ